VHVRFFVGKRHPSRTISQNWLFQWVQEYRFWLQWRRTRTGKKEVVNHGVVC
jgi:hypothetical protein